MEHSYLVGVQARLDEPLSRWLWLVKWLLAIPQYAIVAVFAGGAHPPFRLDQGGEAVPAPAPDDGHRARAREGLTVP